MKKRRRLVNNDLAGLEERNKRRTHIEQMARAVMEKWREESAVHKTEVHWSMIRGARRVARRIMGIA